MWPCASRLWTEPQHKGDGQRARWYTDDPETCDREEPIVVPVCAPPLAAALRARIVRIRAYSCACRVCGGGPPVWAVAADGISGGGRYFAAHSSVFGKAVR